MNSVNTGAKVNLSLHITGKRGTMHTLEMEVCGVSLYDEVVYFSEGVKPFEGRIAFGDCIKGFFPEKFLPVVQRAVAALDEKCGALPGGFLINKHIPCGAGLGGSSAVVASLAKIYEKEKNIALDDGFLLSLGSDVPYMHRGGNAVVSGTGEVVRPEPFVPLNVVIAVPEGAVDTASAYELYDDGVRGSVANGSPRENDLYAAAIRLNAGVERLCEDFRRAGAEDFVMTGSGCAVCAFFAEKKEAEKVLKKIQSGYLTFLTVTVSKN